MALSKTPIPPIAPETIDAAGQVLGRLASQIAAKLLGKDQPTFDPTVAMKRPITVINAEKIVLTGRKTEQKVYRRHTGYPGGLRERSFKEQQTIDPTEIVRHAVRGMLPKNRLLAPRMKQLTIVADGHNGN